MAFYTSVLPEHHDLPVAACYFAEWDAGTRHSAVVLADLTLQTIVLQDGRIKVDEEGRTSLTKVWAGGDCTFGGQDLTVEAVEHGKIAAHSIDCAFGIQRNGPAFQRVRRTAV